MPLKLREDKEGYMKVVALKKTHRCVDIDAQK